MLSSEELKKLFVGKDVVFVYLCLGSEKDKWRPAIGIVWQENIISLMKLLHNYFYLLINYLAIQVIY